jgi:hypothetical protein
MKSLAVGSRHLHRSPAGLWRGYSSNGRYYSVDCLYSSSELALQSRARLQGSDQPLAYHEAVTESRQDAKESELKNRSFFSKGFFVKETF